MPLLNIIKKQNRAHAQFFFAFQVSFKSRDNHDPAVMEVEASKCFTYCKHSNKFVQVNYNLRRPWLIKNLNPPFTRWWICFVFLVRGKIDLTFYCLLTDFTSVAYYEIPSWCKNTPVCITKSFYDNSFQRKNPSLIFKMWIILGGSS